MRINTSRKSGAVNLALTGLMGALVIVGTFISIPIPVLGDRTMIGLGNVFCILSGLLLGPVYGGLAAGVGSGVFDLVGGWASSAPTTLINKFMMAFVCGAIAWSGRSEGRRLYRVIAGAVSGSLTYCVLYLFKSFVEAKLEGSADEAMAILLGTKAAATLHYIIRDHDRAKFEAKKERFRRIAAYLNEKHGDGTIELELADSYYNMREKVEPYLFLIENAKRAMLDVGVTPLVQPIRGGTDGSRLSYMGLPCPNLSTGGHNGHGRFEYIPVQSMDAMVRVLRRLACPTAQNA